MEVDQVVQLQLTVDICNLQTEVIYPTSKIPWDGYFCSYLTHLLTNIGNSPLIIQIRWVGG